MSTGLVILGCVFLGGFILLAAFSFVELINRVMR